MRRASSGAPHASGEWSITRARSGMGIVTARLAAERGVSGPSAAGIEWRGSPPGMRAWGLAEISTRRGRTVHLAIERGRALRASVALRVQERAFHAPRVGVELAVSHVLGALSSKSEQGSADLPPD
jgi:hypothetical protein